MEEKASKMHFHNNGEIWDRWRVNGKLHREGDLPAVIIYYDDFGNINWEEWYVNGKRHREGDKPAVIKYDRYGNIEIEYWWVNGKNHREGNRPVAKHYYDDGSIYYFYEEDLDQ